MTTASIQRHPVAYHSPITLRMSKKGPPTLPLDLPSLRTGHHRRISSVEVGDRIGSSIQTTQNPGPGHTRELSSSSTESQPSSHVCLCQPEPKIPRPRNAFILYRQHHQAQIIAQNPGLSNPDVSKIIGEQWREEPDKEKSKWKFLAEEEKARHQQQYPEYRYQPKRGRRGSFGDNSSSASTSSDRYRCNKCGGRSIRTPSSPFGSAQPTPNVLPSPILPTPTTATLHTGYPTMQKLSMQSPAPHRDMYPDTSHIRTPNPLIRSYADDIHTHSPMSPEAKRRRYNPAYGPPPIQPGSNTPHPFANQMRRETLPRIDQIVAPSAPRLMAPPPPRGREAHAHIQLPALRTPVDRSRPNYDQSRSVEAMVMSMPFLGKIHVLHKISPPLKSPGPITPSPQVRGTLIAIEGDSPSAVQSLTHWLHNFLQKEGASHIRIEPGPTALEFQRRPLELADYLSIINAWHHRSKDIISFLTTATVSATVPVSAPRRSSFSQNHQLHDSSVAASSTSSKINTSPTNSPLTPPTSSPSVSTSTTTWSSGPAPQHASYQLRPQHTQSSSHSSLPHPPDLNPPPSPNTPSTNSPIQKPILLIPSYQVSTSNLYASKIPISDIYSPEDHWQWMATLWRGTVGADLTIYVKDVGRDDSPAGGVGGRGEKAACGAGAGVGVEVKEESGIIIVRRDSAFGAEASTDTEAEAKVNEASLRRLGFEVGEWLRGEKSSGGRA